MSRKIQRSESWTFRRNEQCGLIVVVYLGACCTGCACQGYYFSSFELKLPYSFSSLLVRDHHGSTIGHEQGLFVPM